MSANSLTSRDQLDIAINGSRQFHEKTAASNGPLQPDPILEGHHALATQLNGLAVLLSKTAQYVEQGYPAKIAMSSIANEAGVDSDYQEKIATYLDDLGDMLLQEIVMTTFDEKVRQKTAQATSPGDRVMSSIRRLKQLRG